MARMGGGRLRRPTTAELVAATSTRKRAPSPYDLAAGGLIGVSQFMVAQSDGGGGILMVNADADGTELWSPADDNAAAGYVATLEDDGEGGLRPVWKAPASADGWRLTCWSKAGSATVIHDFGSNDGAWTCTDFTSNQTWTTLNQISSTVIGNVVSSYPGTARPRVGLGARIWRQSQRFGYFQGATAARFKVCLQLQGGGGSSVAVGASEIGVVLDATGWAFVWSTPATSITRSAGEDASGVALSGTPIADGGLYEVVWQSDGVDLWCWVVDVGAAAFGTVVGRKYWPGIFDDMISGVGQSSQRWNPLVVLENRDAGVTTCWTGMSGAWAPHWEVWT
jgi:hypothetical protein